MRKIAVVTGTRAEYGMLKPVMNAIRSSKDLELSLIVTGMHLMEEYGCTLNEIINDGFVVDEKVDMYIPADDGASKAKSLGNGIIALTNAIERVNPDMILVLGDRSEPLAAAIAGAYMQIPVAHIHGGEAVISGHIDESIRFAITKFSHIHFTATRKSAERIQKFGEEQWRIHVVGSPALDSIKLRKIIPRESLEKKLSLDLSKKTILVIQHPVSTESDVSDKQISNTLEAATETGEQVVVVYPNNDVSGMKMINVIESYRHCHNIRICKNLEHDVYLAMLDNVSLLVGNSSSGIIEAPAFHLPVVNIGTRQIGRERSGNIIDAGYDKSSIAQAIKMALYDENFRESVKRCQNPYGDGNASERIVKVLSEIDIGKQLLRKQMTY